MCLTYISWEVFNCTSDWAVKGYVHSGVVTVTTCTMYIRTHGVVRGQTEFMKTKRSARMSSVGVRANRICENQEVCQAALSKYEAEV